MISDGDPGTTFANLHDQDSNSSSIACLRLVKTDLIELHMGCNVQLQTNGTDHITKKPHFFSC